MVCLSRTKKIHEFLEILNHLFLSRDVFKVNKSKNIIKFEVKLLPVSRGD